MKNGIWFVFPLAGATVRAWGSPVTGIERIYVDERLVSEQRSMGKLSEHQFNALGADFRVTFTTISLLRGPLECRMCRNGALLGALRAQYSGLFSGFEASKFVVFLFLVLFGGAVVGMLKVPTWIAAVVGGAVVFVVSLTMRTSSKKGGIQISEITEELPTRPPAAVE